MNRHHSFLDYYIDSGDLESLKEHRDLLKNYYPIAQKLAASGHLECLKFVVQQKCRVDEYVFETAARAGHANCLEFLLESSFDADFKFELSPYAHMSYIAAENGHINCLEVIVKHSLPWNEYTLRIAVGSGHLNCFKYAYEQGCPWDKFVTVEAAKQGFLSVLEVTYQGNHACGIEEP